MAGHLTPDETAELLAAEYGLGDPDLADQVHDTTGGHVDLVRRYGQALAAQGIAHGPLPAGPASGVTADLLSGLPSRARRMLAELSGIAPLSDQLCAALGFGEGALREIEDLLHDGAVIPVVARSVRLGKPPAVETLLRAGRWYEEHGLIASAVRAYASAGDEAQWLRLLDEHGPALLARGHAALIVELLGALPPASRPRNRQLLLGDALRTTGSVMSASNAYSLVADAEREWDAAIALRMGSVHYLRGDSWGAIKAFERAQLDSSSTPDRALLLSWKAGALLQLGEVAAATALAQEAVQLLAASDDDPALATAYVTLALCRSMTGDPTELYAHALEIAERSGDVVLRARVLTNQTYLLVHEARYAEALEAAQETHRCAKAAGHTNMRAIALSNEGAALIMLGRFDEAIRQYERANALCRRMGSHRSAAAELGLGEVYRRRGWLEQARGAYETAARLAEEGGNVQAHVNALIGLAHVLLDSDPGAALSAASLATDLATSNEGASATVARGWVAQRAGDPAAAGYAEKAARMARAARDPAGLAEALELRAALEPDPERARAALREAHAVWAKAGAVVEAARVLCWLGRLPGATTDDRHGALLAAEVLVRAGAARPSATAVSAVVIRAFGRFEVVVGGRVVPASEWQSRKARDLLRILVAKRGQPVPRSVLCELLWPDDDPFKTGHRLSVLLTIVRNALDPERANAPDHYLVADQSSIGLDVTRLRVDVEEFLADATHGRRLSDRGATAEARTLLEAAQSAYTAEVFADEPYAEWATPLREEARAAYIATLRLLARLSDPARAVDYLLRLLSTDPYDESGHRALIEALMAGGQRGEAMRAIERYREAMREIGVRPSV